MVAGSGTQTWSPTIHMDMLRLDKPHSYSRRDKYVVELFVEVVEDVGVPLDSRDISKVVHLVQNAFESLEHRASLNELVPISGDDDACKRIKLEKGIDEILGEIQIILSASHAFTWY